MGAQRTSGAVAPDSVGDVQAWFHERDLEPRTWSNRPGYRYAEHQHTYDKILCCADGSIVFHTPDGDLALEPGDRLDVDAGTPHAATVGEDGVTCVEAAA